MERGTVNFLAHNARERWPHKRTARHAVGVDGNSGVSEWCATRMPGCAIASCLLHHWAKWVLNLENLQFFAPRANVDALQTLVDDA